MAEIVDNSIDAKADNIQIIFVEDTKQRGATTREVIDEIYFLDNGKGMTIDRINSCLTFSEGEGRSDKRIGVFGVGLPNSSISVGRRVDVYSKDTNGSWNYVFLDLDEQLTREEPGYDPSIKNKPLLPKPIILDKDVRTIIKWSKLDKIDASKADTLIKRSKKLLGRIYRYSIQDEISIRIGSCLKGNSSFKVKMFDVIPYDPMFVMERENFITKEVWKWAKTKDGAGTHKQLGDKKVEFNSTFHYSKFTKGHKENVSCSPIFQKFDDFWNVSYDVKIGGETYTYRIYASFAYKSISNPGVRSGGKTALGMLIGEKMTSRTHFRSGNVFFVRTNREIDFGHFGLYAVTDVKNRFWTLEIHFDSDLDDLMGVSNNKQSVEYFVTESSEISESDRNEKLPDGVKREILYAHITEKASYCIKKMKDELKKYAQEFKREEKAALDIGGGGGEVIQVEDLVITYIPKGDEEWDEDKKSEIVRLLKDRYRTITKESIQSQVETFSKGLTKTLVLYAPSEANDLFELAEKRGVLITFINTNHVYYQNIIEPLKFSPKLKVFTIAIEMLLSSCAIEMHRLALENSGKYEKALNTYLLQLSSRLNEFIDDSKIKVEPKRLFEQMKDEVLENID
jgi:hypothetical protein